jgi:hypothetical protein
MRGLVWSGRRSRERVWAWASEAALGQKGGMRARARVREQEAGAGRAGFTERAKREAHGPVSKKSLFLYIFKSNFLLNSPKYLF